MLIYVVTLKLKFHIRIGNLKFLLFVVFSVSDIVRVLIGV